MKLSMLSENLQRKISFLNHAISTRSQLPILLNYLLEARQGKLFICATDLEIGIQTEIPANIEEEGVITIPAKTFSELIATLSQEKTTLQTRGASFDVITQKSKTSFPTMSPEDYPKLYEEKGEKIASLPQKVIQKELGKVIFAAGIDTGRPALSGIYMKKQKEGFLFAATDGYRLSLKNTAVEKEEGAEDGSLIVPARVFKELMQLKEEDVDVFIAEGKNQIIFQAGATIIVGRLIDAQYPPYERIIPLDHGSKVQFDREELQKAVKICAIFARESANIIRFSLRKNSLVVSANSPSVGDNTVDVEATLTGEENEIAFNARYLLDVLGNIEENDMLFEMTGPLNPGVFKIVNDPSYLHLIMPVRVQG